MDQLKIQKRNLLEKSIPASKELEEKIVTLTKRLKNLQMHQDDFILKNEDSYIYEENGEVGFNAYTTSDVTNYQIQLPANRLEVWAKMESDRLINPILREYFTERDVCRVRKTYANGKFRCLSLRERFLSVALGSSSV